ncbi:MAG: hypothetical protein ACI4D8_02075 [Wujia sp.]
MFRVWGRIIKANKLVADYTACIDDYTLTRTQKVYKALDEICYELNLSRPIWLQLNKKDFIRYSRTRFTQDSFIDDIDFDYLAFQVIEEEY